MSIIFCIECNGRVLCLNGILIGLSLSSESYLRWAFLCLTSFQFHSSDQMGYIYITSI